MKPVINALFPVIAFMAIGCSVFEPRWERVAPSMEPLWVQVSSEQMRAICADGFACVRRRFDTRTCLVFSPSSREDAPQFVIHHEEQKHCREGLNHD